MAITGFLIGISALTRLALTVKSWNGLDGDYTSLPIAFAVGFFYDLINALYFVIPLVLIGWLTPKRFVGRRGYRWIISGLVFLLIFILLFNAVSEWIFWDEFSARFNFIAVDYLVYTNEVIGNIRQSYPVEIIILLLTAASVGSTAVLMKMIRRAPAQALGFGKRTLVFGVYAITLLACYKLIDNRLKQFSANTFVNELAGNGMYELFAAYRNNELNYNQFYASLDQKKAFTELHSLIRTKESHFTSQDPHSIERDIVNTGPEFRRNVILISVESLSADFLGCFGNTQEITPNLDSLATKSLLFTNLYATGTRTVRGLEALSLATPPTPGQSIVRRPANEDLFSLGSVFKHKGYQTRFIYGGYGYFDNMGYFFDHNSYKVVDRTALSKKEIDYENIWGVADENLFQLTIKEIDRTTKEGRPIFAHVMTTSNHRPYTYPEGRIDIPSHTGREGAVKYTDFAIGQFISSASKKPWFKNTVFVIVADHCASSAGKTDLPVNRYKIPLLIYSPGLVKPGQMPRLMSQIDLAPTLLGLLNFSYKSKFFGYDIFKLEEGRERAFISTYQSLGYIRHDSLVILRPQRLTDTFLPNFSDGSAKPVKANKQLVEQAIAWYQCASFQFGNGLMKTTSTTKVSEDYKWSAGHKTAQIN
ncbi:MAG: sulfatase [Dyadobacter sp. 50-39]|uniref:LTA synthase family protein n=1 Tax=Dyadobacter sp. 50-39 TaxID=1895756 RepID=UPI0009644DBF|nr:LTA synthase family protein [Dyadobacter sp. 50-39]OJV22569.1 MAG: sulfatase [Dyadobacter sp. 50-39]